MTRVAPTKSAATAAPAKNAPAPVAPVTQAQQTQQQAQSNAGAPVPTTTAPPPNVPQNSTGATTTEGEAAPKKRGRKPREGAAATVQRIFHPLLEAKEKTLESSGKKVMRPTKKIAEIPADYNPKLHKPLKRNDFEDESIWYELQAQKLEAKAKELREEGKQLKTLGGVKDRADAKKLLAMQKRMLELLTQMQSKGVKVDDIQAKIAHDLQAKLAVNTENNAAKSVEGATAS